MLLVARAVPSSSTSLISLLLRLKNSQTREQHAKNDLKKLSQTHSSVVSVVLVARAVPSVDTSLIWLPPRL